MQIRTPHGGYETRAISGTIPYGDTVPPQPGGNGIPGGVQVSLRSAMQQVAVYGSCAAITESIATLPIKQYRLVGGIGGELREMDVAPVIAKPFSEIDQCDFITQGTMSMLLSGDFWGQVISRDDRLDPEQIKPVHPDHARIRRNQQGQLEVRYWGKPVPLDQVSHKMGLSLPEGLEGISPIENLRRSIARGLAQDMHALAHYANSAQPGGVIEVGEDLDEEETQAMALAWNAGHRGINQSGLTAILTGGATFKPISMSLADAQFLEQMQWTASEISGMIYRVPPHMLGMTDKETSWGAGIEQMELGFVRNTLGIWLKRWEDLMASWLPPRQCVLFDLSERLRGDALQRWSSYQIARVIGVMNGAEVRMAEGLPKVTDAKASALLEAYDTPFTSSPVKAVSSSGVGPGGDKSD